MFVPMWVGDSEGSTSARFSSVGFWISTNWLLHMHRQTLGCCLGTWLLHSWRGRHLAPAVVGSRAFCIGGHWLQMLV